MAMLITFATGGINLYKHYCLCTGQTLQSVFVDDTACGHHGAEQMACCSSNVMGSTESHSKCESDHKCCSEEYYFFKTDQYDYSKSPKNSFEFIIAYEKDVKAGIEGFDHKEFKFMDVSSEIPPPSYGKMLLCELQQLKIDLPIVS
ncbi:MAG: hypothetical protein KQI35_04635 [Bacteroidetes bacterium]|nr:hypothetical protein [Bacteroidota bacterium]